MNGKVFDGFPIQLIPKINNNGIKNKHTSSTSSSSHESSASSFYELDHPGSNVWVIPNFLSSKECYDWIDFCEQRGGDENGDTSSSSASFFQYTAHPASSMIAHRQCYRLQQLDATDIAHRIYERIQYNHGALLPTIQRVVVEGLQTNTSSTLQRQKRRSNKSSSSSSSYRPITCNPNIRVYKYMKGHSFGRHIDESNIVSIAGLSADGTIGTTTKTTTTTTQEGRTEATILIYLSDCEGGATRFYHTHHNIGNDINHSDSGSSTSKKKKTKKNGQGEYNGGTHNNTQQQRPTSKNTSSFAYQPQIGSMLIHIHGDNCLEHEGEPVLGDDDDGTTTSIKYVLRTDLVFGVL